MRALFLSTLLALSLPLSGCTLLVGDQIDPLETDDTPDMVFDLIGFDPHIGQITELWLVNDATPPIVQAVAIYDPLPGPDVTVVLRNVVRPNVRRVDFFSDLDESGGITAPEPDPITPGRFLFPDHMWRRTLDEDGTGGFMHSTDFTDITSGPDAARFSLGDFQMSITGAGDFIDQPAELWVTDAGDREVGYYFLGSITDDSVDLAIPGIIDDGSEYVVVFAPGRDGDLFCLVRRGNASGLSVSGALGEALVPCDQ